MRPFGARPALLALFAVLLVALLLDTAGISVVPWWPRPAPTGPIARRSPRVARHGHAGTMGAEAEEGESAAPSSAPETPPPLPLRAEDAPSSPALASRPSPSPTPPSRPSPSSRPRATQSPPTAPAASPSPTGERPEEIEVRASRPPSPPSGGEAVQESPAEVQVTTAVVGPPDGSTLLPENGRVTLGWPPGDARAWRVEVLANGRPAFSDDVTVPSVTFSALPGPLYQWRVTARPGGGATPWHKFQVAASAAIDFHGKDGARGRGGGDYGENGGPGGDGADGQDADVYVEAVDGWIRVRAESSLGWRETLYLLPTAGPVRVVASGGAGGPGGSGATGQAAVVNTRGGVVVATNSGGNGGPGGRGGRGGTIRLHAANGLDRYVEAVVRGGPGGPGGAGGSGAMSTGLSAAGPDGRPGTPGEDGKPGSVVVAP